MTYHITGMCVEVCSCIDCGCHTGHDAHGPKGAVCEGAWTYHIEEGQVDGVDVGGLTFAGITRYQGNLDNGAETFVAIVDERASPEQRDALVAAFTGKLGGPLAELSRTWGELEAVRPAKITFQNGGKGATLVLGDYVNAETKPVTGDDGQSVQLVHGKHSPNPGCELEVQHTVSFAIHDPEDGVEVDVGDRGSAFEGPFRFSG